MRKIAMLLLILLIATSIPSSVKAASNQSEQPVVNAVLFWTNGCPYCSKVLTDVLPPIQDKYDSRLSILLIELVSSKDIDSLYTLGEALGMTKEQIEVPFLLIDHTALVGVGEIDTRLVGLVEKYLASGGLAYPSMPVLDELLPKGIAYSSSGQFIHSVAQTTVETNATGMALAWGVMIFMGIALILSIVMILLAFQGKPMGDLKNWLDLAMPVLSIIGLGVSIYLTYIEVSHARAVCGPVGDCNAVQNSSYAKLFGVVPIGLVGALGYIAILVAWLWRRLRTDALSKIAGSAIFGMALFGTLFSIYLTYLELFVIRAVCIWCLSSAVIITVLMLLGLPSITQWLAISDEEE